MTPQEVGQLWEGFKHSKYAYYMYTTSVQKSCGTALFLLSIRGNILSPLYFLICNIVNSCAGNFTDFWTVNKKLMRTIRGDKSPFRYIPFCVYKVSRPFLCYLSM